MVKLNMKTLEEAVVVQFLKTKDFVGGSHGSVRCQPGAQSSVAIGRDGGKRLYDITVAADKKVLPLQFESNFERDIFCFSLEASLHGNGSSAIPFVEEKNGCLQIQ